MICVYLLVTGRLQQMVFHLQLFFHDLPHFHIHLQGARCCDPTQKHTR